jgi:hypothetical protein
MGFPFHAIIARYQQIDPFACRQKIKTNSPIIAPYLLLD